MRTAVLNSQKLTESNRSREKIAVMVLAASCAMNTALTVSTGSTLMHGHMALIFFFYGTLLTSNN